MKDLFFRTQIFPFTWWEGYETQTARRTKLIKIQQKAHSASLHVLVTQYMRTTPASNILEKNTVGHSRAQSCPSLTFYKLRNPTLYRETQVPMLPGIRYQGFSFWSTYFVQFCMLNLFSSSLVLQNSSTPFKNTQTLPFCPLKMYHRHNIL